MSIKTNELQQLNAPQGVDSILLDSLTAGTGRLSLSSLAQFLTEQDNAVKTALSNKAALSVQQTVEATNLPSRTVEVAAEDLPAYINSLPRLLMADIDIKVTGTLTEFLYIHRFSSGSLSIDGNGDCRLQGGVSIRSSSAIVVLKNLELSLREEKLKLNDIVDIQFSDNVSIRSCSVAGSKSANTEGANTEGEVGVRADHHSCAALINCGISNCRIAVFSAGSTIVSVYNENRGDFSGNAAGPYVFRGGIILLGGNTSAKCGGMIVKGDGTLL